jgi:hypothetical protein
MSELKLLAIALLLWGASNLAANTTSGGDLDGYKIEISQRLVHLNRTVPDLHVRQRAEPMNIPAALETISDVQKLENALKGVETVPPHSLTTLVCERALCFQE